jgi:putative oxidoreductase
MNKKIIGWIMYESTALQHLGLAIIRISFGIVFLIFGYKKIVSGSTNLTQVGSAMALFGITRGYIFWGYLAALTELCGGLALSIGFCSRIASIPLILLLIVALRFHIQKGDPFTTWAFPCICLCAAIAFLIAGSGVYSIDHITNCVTQEAENR